MNEIGRNDTNHTLFPDMHYERIVTTVAVLKRQELPYISLSVTRSQQLSIWTNPQTANTILFHALSVGLVSFTS